MARRLASRLASLALLLAVVGVAFWAGTNAVVPPNLPVEMHEFETYQVEVGTVSSYVNVPVTASWPATQVLPAAAGGVVTSVVHAAGELATAGAVLATLQLEPIVIAQGSVPMFRPLREGTRGPDVAQFQRLLRKLGFLSGPADGRFGPITAAATRRWQRSVRANVDAIVGTGSLVFVDALPARVEFLAAVADQISIGNDLVRILASQPIFTATIAPSQRSDLASGLAIAVVGPEGASWPGTLGSFEPLDDGRFVVEILSVKCAPTCERIPILGETTLTGSITLVPETSGVVVPTSALILEPSGGLTVTLESGVKLPVVVVAEADGFAVVDGLEPGTVIRLPSRPDP